MKQLNFLPLIAFFIFFPYGNSKNIIAADDSSNVSQLNAPGEVKICNQVWMNRNLDVSFFRNGDAIPEAKSVADWNKAGMEKQPAWCYYKNDTAMGKKYGKLYNWYAVNDSRGLAPQGWHVPTDEEWWTLRNCIKEKYNNHSEKLKSATDDWFVDKGKSTQGNDSTGFTALPAGQRLAGTDGTFKGLSLESDFWTATKKSYGAYYVSLLAFGNYIYGSPTSFEFGMSVRCVKD